MQSKFFESAHANTENRRYLKMRGLSSARKIIDKESSAQRNFSCTIANVFTIHALRFGTLFFQIQIPPTHMRGLT